MNIFVGGSLNNVPRDKELCGVFVESLAHAIVGQGHTLLNGCRSSLDLATANAAKEWLVNNSSGSSERTIKERIKSYCLAGHPPIHNIGTVSLSELSDWNMSHPDLKLPEQIRDADVAIFVAGGEGTFWAKNWAQYGGKSILGIPRFGGAAEVIYHLELARLSSKDSALAKEYEWLNQLVTDNFQAYAKETIERAARLHVPRSIFAIMSFKPEFDDIYRSYQAVCLGFNFKAERTSDPNAPDSNDRILPRIEMGIRQSGIVIADVSDKSPNVFYELGFAKALGKDVIVTAREGTERPFDISDVPILYWKEPKDLKKELKKRLQSLKQKYGI